MLTGLVAPGTVAVSDAAVELARKFAEEIKRTRPGESWIVGFDWADERRIRFPRNSNHWEDLGPGLDLGAYERERVPAAMMATVDGVEFVVCIPRAIYEKADRRMIDRDDAKRTKLVLL
jgi:hypothetical protein